MKITLKNILRLLPVLLAGCASVSEDKAGIPLDSDPRIGAEVNQVCFTRNIHSWNKVDNDRQALILEMNNRETYKLKLGGGCDPDWAMVQIAVITRGGANCFSSGDRIRTDGDMRGMACMILKINKWDADAASQTN